MIDPRELTPAEALVYAAAFARAAAENRDRIEENQAAHAVTAAFEAVELLRRAQGLACVGNGKHAKEKESYDLRHEEAFRKQWAYPLFRSDYRETSFDALVMLGRFERVGGDS